MPKIKTTNIKIKDLKPAKYNPRRISQTEMDSLMNSIEKFGFVEAIVINKNNVIIGGHQRVKACKKLGIDEIPAVVVDLTEDKEKALNIALNKISGEWDEQLLIELIENMDEELVGLTGFSDGELKKLFFKNGNKINRSLLEEFIIPPFSIFDTKQAYWQKRKKEWIEQIGDSGVGRDDALLGEGMKNLSEKMGLNLAGTSIFDPVLTEVVYTWFCKEGGLVIDPFAGGNTRGAIAALTGYKYIGTDLSKKQVEANKKWAKKTKTAGAEWINDDGLNLEKYVKKGEADFLLACPPYYDLEKYTDDPDDLSNKDSYEDFLKIYAEILGKTYDLMKDGTFACIVVGNIRDKNGYYHNFVGDTITAMEKAGFRFYNEIILAQAIASAALRARKTFTASKKVVKTHQNILFFTKGKEVKIKGALKRVLETGQPATGHYDVLVFKRS